MKNGVKCGKPNLPIWKYGNPQPSPEPNGFREGSETIPLREYSGVSFSGGSAPHPLKRFISLKGDEIVHPLEKSRERCKPDVVGSNPTRGVLPVKIKSLIASAKARNSEN